MLIRDCIDPNILSLNPSVTVQDAVKLMSKSKASVAVVFDGQKIHGYLSGWDLIARSMTEKWDEINTPLISVARRFPYCFDDDSPDDVAFLMWLNQVDNIVVLDKTSRPIGTISSHLLLNVRAARKH